MTRRTIAVAVAAIAATLAAVTIAMAASAPTATTGAATAVTDTSATLNGTVNPNGQATTYHFEYGTTTAYGQQTTSQSAGSGTTDQSASANVTGLNPGTTYHVRVVATNPSGTTDGADMTFTTTGTAPKPIVTTTAATSVGTSTATLNGIVNPNGEPTTYTFEYGTSTSYGQQTTSQLAGSGTTSQNVSASVPALRPNTTYHFRIDATNPSGTTQGADLTFKTAPLKPAVTTGSASGVTFDSATLTGTVNPGGQATTYRFKYGTTPKYGHYGPVQSAGSGTTVDAVSTAVSRLRANTTYHFRLVATNGSGSTSGNDVTFRTAAAPPTPLPPAVTTASATKVGRSGATLNGSVDPRGFATTWWFEYGQTTAYGAQTTVRSLPAAMSPRGVAARLSGLQAGRTYHFRLIAHNANGTTTGVDSTFSMKAPPRVSPRRVTARTTPARARRFPTTFTTRGTVVLPRLPSGERSQACTGQVLIRLQGGRRFRNTISTRSVRLGANCAYSSRLTFNRSRGRLRVRVQFLGNAVLKPRNAPARYVRT